MRSILVLTVFKTLTLTILIFNPGNCKYTNPEAKRVPSSSNLNPAQQQQAKPFKNSDVIRLPKYLDPIHYRLHLIPLLQNSIVLGSVQINLIALQSTSNLFLHMKNITLHKASIKELPVKTAADPNPMVITNQIEDPSRDLRTFVLNKPINVQQHYRLQLEFTSLIRDDLTGFYKSTYVEEWQGQKKAKTVGVTQLSPISARTLFPCFDQPDFKSKFELSIARDSTTNYTVISNMEKSTKPTSAGSLRVLQRLTSYLPNAVAGQIQWENYVWENFKTSLPMSTYLLAFVISEFKHKETYFLSGVSDKHPPYQTQQVQVNVKPSKYWKSDLITQPYYLLNSNGRKGKIMQYLARQSKVKRVKSLRIWSRPDLINQTNYALSLAPKLVEFYEEYLGMEYPLEKLDIVAVPDFDQGAMENFGMVTFREVLLLVDPETPLSMKNIISSTIAHEISHQWFGDLVTMDWWSDLWLTEGFAVYMEYVEPTWNKMTTFLSREVYEMLDLDSLNSSHPISAVVNNPIEVPEVFDSISYSKGAAVIRMLANFITEETFQHGVNRYLTKWKFNNTRAEDLWAAMTDQASVDGITLGNKGEGALTVGEIMHGWTHQVGFPVIQVHRNYEEPEKVLFTQSQFKLDLRDVWMTQGTNAGKKWWIPISYASPTINSNFEDVKPKFWLSAKEHDFILNEKDINLNSNDWLIVNVKQTGLYRVNYDSQNWKLLIDQLHKNHNAISVENRGQLINDAWSLARASMLTYDIPFALSNYLKDKEQEYLPWKSIQIAMKFIHNMYVRSLPELELFKVYLRSIVDNQLGKFGFIGKARDSVPLTETRQVLIELACMADHPDCITVSKQMFTDWMRREAKGEKNTIPFDYRRSIYCTAVKYGTDLEWNFLLGQYTGTNAPSTKRVAMQGLTCSRNTDLITRLLNLAISDSQKIIRKGDVRNVLTNIAVNSIGTNMVLDLLNDKWLQISSRIPSLDSVVEVFGDRLNTNEDLAKLENFKSKYTNNLGTSTRTLTQALEKISINIQWMDKFSRQVSHFMQK